MSISKSLAINSPVFTFKDKGKVVFGRLAYIDTETNQAIIFHKNRIGTVSVKDTYEMNADNLGNQSHKLSKYMSIINSIPEIQPLNTKSNAEIDKISEDLESLLSNNELELSNMKFDSILSLILKSDIFRQIHKQIHPNDQDNSTEDF